MYIVACSAYERKDRDLVVIMIAFGFALSFLVEFILLYLKLFQGGKATL